MPLRSYTRSLGKPLINYGDCGYVNIDINITTLE